MNIFSQPMCGLVVGWVLDSAGRSGGKKKKMKMKVFAFRPYSVRIRKKNTDGGGLDTCRLQLGLF
jgi:hypothetical protein